MADNDELKATLDALRRESAAEHAETRRLFDEAAVRIATENREFFGLEVEGLRHQIQLVAEGVDNLGQAVDREMAEIRAEIRRTAAETQALIQSYMRPRVDRLES